jgi:sulfite reductase (NADPH) flavoprotein alpha-component
MQPVYVLFGTESGNAQGLAKRTGEALEKAGLAARVIDMMDFEGPDLEKLRLLLVVTSTYGNGDPPSNAEALHAFLMKKCPPLPALTFSVCALGDTTYDRFANCGKEFDRRLGELGARRLIERTDCDVDYEGPFQQWLGDVVAALVGLRARAPAAEAAEPEPDVVHAHVDASGTRRNPVRAKVLANVNLNGAGSTKETRHLALDVRAQPLAYAVGDSIGIWPENDPAVVEAVARAAGTDLAARVRLPQGDVSLGEALARHLEVQQPDARLVQRAHPDLDSQGVQRAVSTSHVVDVLGEVGRSLSPDELVDLLRPLAPRLYSVASSPRVHPGEIHLLVDVLRYELRGRPRLGVTSSHVTARAEVGASLSIFLHPSPSFRLASPDHDIVMIGPGTGVAPFRAFLEERSVDRGAGRSWLFFGSRNRATDFLYEEDFTRFVDAGVLTRLDLAFSRDQRDKLYVQHRMLERAAELYAWIQAGAYVYVCGDAKRMAPDVHAALLRILATQGDRTEEAARQELDEMTKSGRYVRDVY